MSRTMAVLHSAGCHLRLKVEASNQTENILMETAPVEGFSSTGAGTVIRYSFSVNSWYSFISAATQSYSLVIGQVFPYASQTARSLCWWALRSSGGMVSSS